MTSLTKAFLVDLTDNVVLASWTLPTGVKMAKVEKDLVCLLFRDKISLLRYSSKCAYLILKRMSKSQEYLIPIYECKMENSRTTGNVRLKILIFLIL